MPVSVYAKHISVKIVLCLSRLHSIIYIGGHWVKYFLMNSFWYKYFFDIYQSYRSHIKIIINSHILVYFPCVFLSESPNHYCFEIHSLIKHSATFLFIVSVQLWNQTLFTNAISLHLHSFKFVQISFWVLWLFYII